MEKYMKQHPIIFSGPMINAILTGRKTQTRRVVRGGHSKFSVGDKLWVREKFSARLDIPGTAWYWADGNPKHGDWSKPKPSIFMPRQYARVFLKITGVNTERLHDISNADAIAEGARKFNDISLSPLNSRLPEQAPRWSMESPESTDQCLGSPYWAYANYWEKMNGKRGYGWETNPQVLRIEFSLEG